MSRLTLFLLLTIELSSIKTAFITNKNPYLSKLEKYFDTLESITLSPNSKVDSINSKIDVLNSLSVKDYDDEDELVTALQMWGSEGETKDAQVKEDLDDEYADDAWSEDEYPMDGEDWDQDEDIEISTRPSILVTPLSVVRSSAIRLPASTNPIAATLERPRILDDSMLTHAEITAVRQEALENLRYTQRFGRCHTPQPRWLSVKEMAPAADIIYLPPRIQLHRCFADISCCPGNEECGPVEGEHVIVPFFLHKADGTDSVARLLFYNHTRCSCKSYASMVRKTIRRDKEIDTREIQNEWPASTEEPKMDKDEETVAPMLRRCTCPTLFISKVQNDTCTCVCDWPDLSKKRDCLYISRGNEHFGIRDRVCISNGDCTLPTCEHGTYMRNFGKCPVRKLRRNRFNRRYL